jgi:hypothetical protein
MKDDQSVMGSALGQVSAPAMGEATGEDGPWGFWATAGFLLIVAAVYILSAVLLAVAFVISARPPHESIPLYAKGLAADGLYIVLSLIVPGTACTPLLVYLARLRRGYGLTEYLGLKLPAPEELQRWVLVAVCFLACEILLTSHIVRPRASPLVAAFQRPLLLPLVLVGMCVVAPVFEELLFRGFLFEGIWRSSLGPVGGVSLSALGWAALHFDRDVFHQISLFLFGLILGYARLRTSSTPLVIAMHAAYNLAAFLLIIVLLYAIR